MSVLRDLGRLALRRKKFWLFPLMLLALIYGSIAMLSKGSVVAPFIYTLF